MLKANSWYVGANIPGKPRVFLPDIGGLSRYIDECAGSFRTPTGASPPPDRPDGASLDIDIENESCFPSGSTSLRVADGSAGVAPPTRAVRRPPADMAEPATTTPEKRLNIEELRAAVRQIAVGFPDAYWSDRDQAGVPLGVLRRVRPAGWLGIAIPEIRGRWPGHRGRRGDAVRDRRVGRGHERVQPVPPHHVRPQHCREARRRGPALQLLPAAASGSLHVCFAVTEPDAGTDTSRVSTRARRDGPDWVVNGKKVWITKAGQSQKAVLLARTSPIDESRPTKGLSLFIADITDPAVQMRAILGRPT